MNCQDAAFWRACLDHDSPLPRDTRDEAANHLIDCGDCRELADRMKLNQRLVGAALDTDEGRTVAAWERFASSLQAGPAAASPAGRWKPMAVAASICIAALSVVALPPVRTVASEILQLFRAEKFAAIKIDPQAMIDFNPEKLGKFTFDQPAPRQVTTMKEAIEVSGLAAKEPGNLPAGLARAALGANAAGTVSLTFDLKKFRAYLHENKIEGINLPPALDGKTMVGHIPPMVIMEYSQGGVGQNAGHPQPELVVFQAGLPSLEAPAGFNADSIRDELIKLPVFPPAVRDQLRATSDWKRTLPVPYPANEATAEKVDVGGTEGLYFTANDGTKVLIWAKREMAFGLVSPEAGGVSKPSLFAVADSLK